MLARTTERHTGLLGSRLPAPTLQLATVLADGSQSVFEAALGDINDTQPRWARYATAAAYVLNERHGPLPRGLDCQMRGSMIAAGLSSSASYLLAILAALCEVNDLQLDKPALVELVREVEHDWFGLTNGVQDQLSILHGQENALILVDPDAVCADTVSDPRSFLDAGAWLLCFSGVSRELADSGYNRPVADCHAAAALLQPGATRLGDVSPERRESASIDALDPPLARRARHVYGEMARVADGVNAWKAGDLSRFGELMNASCHSSITLYESGSEWLVALHEIAGNTRGVYGNRFSGGGYGGCLVMLVEQGRIDDIAADVLGQYLARYPDLADRAHCFAAGTAAGLQVMTGTG